jgi:hypothetical protein
MVKGPERTLGFDKSNPTRLSRPSRTEPAKVKPKLTRNRNDNRFSLPNISVSTTAERTNIHANPQIKAAEAEPELNHDAKTGTGPPNVAANVLIAD